MQALPPLSEHLKNFVFAYTEHSSVSKMAEKFGVNRVTIYRWLSRPEVRLHVARLRYDRDSWRTANLLHLERKWFQHVGQLIDYPISDANMPAKVMTLKLAYEALRGVSPMPGGARIGRPVDREALNERVLEEVNVTPDDVKKHIAKAQEALDMIQYLDNLDEKDGGNGHAGGNGAGGNGNGRSS